MNIKEVAELLNWRPDNVITAIVNGLELPKSKKNQKLVAEKLKNDYFIKDEDLERFHKAFEKEDPGRYIPIRVRRALRSEANFRCAICRNAHPLEMHHIIEYSEIKHHDPEKMLAICPTCHTLCGLGKISLKEQRERKKQLKRGVYNDRQVDEEEPIRFDWYDLTEIIEALSLYLEDLDISADKYDFGSMDIEKKNRLNDLGKDYFMYMQQDHEPYFQRIDEFIKNPVNKNIVDLYYGIVEELKAKIAANQQNFKNFESLLINFLDQFIENATFRMGKKKKVVQILISYMYFNCDIGRKL